MIKRTIEIDGRPVEFRASAAIPRLYRAKFRRDIFKDLVRLDRQIEKRKKRKVENSAGPEDGSEEDGSDIPIDDLELFENVAYVMAKHADPSQPDTPEDWLDQFNTFSIYEVLPQLLDLWHLNMEKDVEAKKNGIQVVGK